jgi:hypothetical protein
MSEEPLISLRTYIALAAVGSSARRYILLSLAVPEAPRVAGRQPIHVSFVHTGIRP